MVPSALPPIEVGPRDLAAYRDGNVGIPYVHRFDSGRSGPHVLVNALTHGNEFCGMVAACDLLDRGIRPSIGTLTVSFANVAAYESFDPARPFDSRQITHNLNRIWSAAELDGDGDSVELRRARELRPVVAAADHVLDIHSTSQDVVPFWVYTAFARNAAVATALSQPITHLLMPDGLGTGTPLIRHGRHGDDDFHGVSLVVECGQHFRRASADTAIAVTRGFLAHHGLVDRDPTQEDGDDSDDDDDHAADAPSRRAPHRRYRLLQTHLVHTPEFRFVRPLVGFETFAAGEPIATDGDREIRSPCDGCTVFMPTREPIVGREAVYLTQPVD